MKIAIINDSHFGTRNDSDIFFEVQRDFFRNTFFPYCKQHDIKRVLHLGDLFDRRKYINYKTFARTEKLLFTTMMEEDIEFDVIPGNHDIYYKDTNKINSMNLIAGKYSNVTVYDEEPVVVDYDGTSIALVPWICRENYEQSMDFIKNVDVDIMAGHFEIVGFELMPGINNHEGLTKKLFERFDQVWSGHFHHKSRQGNIQYLGTQYELTWSDYGHQKGFHVFDTETQQLEFVPNPSTIFTKIFYDDEKHDYNVFNFEALYNNYVKVIVLNKENHFMFDRFIDNIQMHHPADLSIIEDPQSLEDDEFDINQTQDTITILENYVDQMEIDADRKRIKGIIRELHAEALRME